MKENKTSQPHMKMTNKILVIDLEATCWENEMPDGQLNEIIEIGVCMLDIVSGTITHNRGILVKPVHSEISAFCTSLTTIDQTLIDAEGITLIEACDILTKEYNAAAYTWASYGTYDLNMMKSQCRKLNIAYPLSEEHINVKEVFAKKFSKSKRKGMKSALDFLEITLEGTHHRGVDDAKNIAKILYRCLKENYHETDLS
jgi:inhibitor of KinA sporulation pathway (predicted exonuclease)